MSSSTFIYFISDGRGFIKIGKAQDVTKRLRGLQTGAASKLIVAGLIRGPESLESALHKRFAQYRAQGEWFLDCPEIQSFLKEQICKDTPGPSSFALEEKIKELENENRILNEELKCKRVESREDALNALESEFHNDITRVIERVLSNIVTIRKALRQIEKRDGGRFGNDVWLELRRAAGIILEHGYSNSWRNTEQTLDAIESADENPNFSLSIELNPYCRRLKEVAAWKLENREKSA